MDDFGFIPDKQEDDFGFVPDEAKPNVSQWEALKGGMSQGATLGFADEAKAGLIAGAESLFGDAPFSETYESLRDAYRDEMAQEQQAHPGTFMAGSVVGAAPLTIASGGLSGGTVKGAAALGAGEGAISGLGTSEAKDVSGMVRDTATGAAIGGLLGGALPAIANKATGLPTKVADDLIPEMEKRFAAQEAADEMIDFTPSFKEIGNSFKKGVKEAISGDLSKISKKEAALVGTAASMDMTGLGLAGYLGFKGAKKVADEQGKAALFTAAAALEIPAQAVQKYIQAIEKAAVRGPQAVVATEYILQSQNEDYRRLIRKLDEENR